jgi:hypothetical protein
MNTKVVEKNRMLKEAISLLRSRNLPSDWAGQSNPYSALQDECTRLMQDPGFASELKVYLKQRAFVSRSVEMLLIYMAMSENSRWEQTPDWMHPARFF